MFKVLEPANVLKTEFRLLGEVQSLENAIKLGDTRDQPGYVVVDDKNVCVVDALEWDCDYRDFEKHYSYDFLGLDLSKYAPALG